MSVSLNEVVRLQCPAMSRLSQQRWQRPNSRLSPDLYLQLKDGSLSFVTTPITLGHYLCVSTENGYQQTVAIYHVKQKSGSMIQIPSSSTWPHTHPNPTIPGTEPVLRNSVAFWPKTVGVRQGKTVPTLSSRDTQVTTRQHSRYFTLAESVSQDGQTQGPCYLMELVVVSILLVLCLSLLITLLLYGNRKRCHSRTAPQVAPSTRDSDRSTPVEQEALSSQFLSRRAINSRQESNFICNGVLTGSNGHLPNTPI